MAPRRTFGSTWWGQAWLSALEGRAVHDPNRLPRGRTYARRGDVTIVEREPGFVAARVLGSRPQPYRVELFIRTFRDDEWESIVDLIAHKAAHAAALLAGELDPAINDAASAIDIELLPRSGELNTSCTCPDWAEPCKHAAAVCYLLADVFDHDPFAIMALRGMRREQLIEAIRARRAEVAAEEATRDVPRDGFPSGLDPVEGWSRELGPLPVIPRPDERPPGRVAVWPTDPPVGAPFTADGLRRLAADAVKRAWAIRSGDGDAALGLALDADLARRAASISEIERRALAHRSGRSPAHLQTVAEAWRFAGERGLAAEVEKAWAAPPIEMAMAKEAIETAGFGHRSIRVRSNRITADGENQFRRSRDGRWYHYSKKSGRWLLTSEPSEEIEELLAPSNPEE